MILTFIIIGMWLLLNAEYLSTKWIIHNYLVIEITGGLTIFIFGSMLVLSFKLMIRKTALIIEKEGFTDLSSVGGEAGFIKWDEVRDIQQIEINGTTVIKVLLIDPISFINRRRSFFSRLSLKRNYSTYRTPVIIPMFSLNIYVDDLEKILRDYWEQGKKM